MDSLALRGKVTELIKKYRYALLVVLLGLGLMCFPTPGKESQVQNSEPTEQAERNDLPQQLSQILSQIQGAGKVQVMLSVAQGEKTVYQTDDHITGGENSSSRVTTVIITGGDRAQSGLIQQINPPTYLGAVVVCQGAEKASVKLAIVEAVSKATGLGSDKISVLKMK